MSKILCIVDGMNDESFKQSDYKYLSKMKLAYYQDTCLGLPPETFSCVMHILGVLNIPKYLRGYVEALGAGISVKEGDLILRGSWYSLDENGQCKAPCKAPVTAMRKLSLLEERVDCIYYPIGDYRSILVFPRKAGEIDSLKTFPPSRETVLNRRPEGSGVVAQAFDFFKGKDCCLIPWGEALVQKEVFLEEKEKLVCSGESARETAVISGTTVVRGIAKLLGMKLLDVKGITGDVDTPLLEKTKAALEAAKEYDRVILHINGADEASHRKNAEEKRNFLKKTDETVLAGLLASDHEIVVVSDHGTNPITGTHTGELQPVFVNK